MAECTIWVEVVYATVQEQIKHRIELPRDSTVRQAIDASGIFAATNGFDPNNVGIFSRRVSLDHTLSQGDRIEIYRSLSVTPMEARRRRARS
jgi:putative ubiquitin-RnfH superfamily antitoxin RatB of RatAB toxin-antitoxin module